VIVIDLIVFMQNITFYCFAVNDLFFSGVKCDQDIHLYLRYTEVDLRMQI